MAWNWRSTRLFTPAARSAYNGIETTASPLHDGTPAHRDMMDRIPPRREELANVLTHGLGVLAAVAGSAVLLSEADWRADRARWTASVVYCGCLLLLYSVSTLYHGVSHPGLKARLQVLDHAAIYLLIAGTYTPFLLLGLRGWWGETLLVVVWALAAAGVVFKLFGPQRWPLFSTALYIAMGWIVLVAVGPAIEALTLPVIGWLLAGGLIYTGGTVAYHYDRIPYVHALWHLFVLGGSFCHYVAVMLQFFAMPVE